MQLRSILVAIEFPAAKSQLGLTRAVELAARTRARLVLFHAAYDPEIGDMNAGVNDPRVQYVIGLRRRQLEALARDFKLDPAHCSVEAQWAHTAVDAVSQAANAHAADLVIAESTRRGRFARFVLTNTDWELIRHVPAPLLLVKSAKPIRKAPVLCAIDPTHAHDKPAELDDAILEAGKNFAGALHGRVVVYHSYPAPVLPPTIGTSGVLVPLPIRGGPAARAERRRAAVERVAGLVQRHKLVAPKVVVEEGDSRQLLPERALAERAQVVVLGAVARGGLDRVLIGSTAESVLDRLECDVLVVKLGATRQAAKSARRPAKRKARRP